MRLNVITNLHHASDLLGPEQLQATVLPAIEDLTSVRCASANMSSDALVYMCIAQLQRPQRAI